MHNTTKAMQDIYFPFEKIRPIQAELMRDVLSTISDRKALIAHAPTGLGKTAATLGPAVTAALKEGLNVFFLTPKHTQHQIAVETLQKLKERHNLKFNVADLIGKKWLCSQSAVETLDSKEFHNFCRDMVAEEKCPFYNNVWSKGSNKLMGKASFALNDIKSGKILHAEELKRQYDDEFCIYELATLLAKDSTVVIADYYHLFHPSVRNAFLGKLKKELKNSVIIVDEAHNLPDRIRSILSERLSSFTISKAVKEARAFHLDELEVAASQMQNVFSNLNDELLGDNNENILKKDKFVTEVESATGCKYDDLINNLVAAAAEVRRNEKKSHLGSIASFLSSWQGEEDGYARLVKKQYTRARTAFTTISYNCLNPAAASADIFSNCAASILMSGTLIPGEFYRDLLGFKPEKTQIKVYPSPFEAKNRLVLIENSTTTKFTERNPAEFEKIAKICSEIIREVPHNVAVFFPSYLFMQSMLSFMDGKITKQVFVDGPELSKQQRVEILNSFKAASEAGAVLFGVTGGSFAEGIDLPGKFLEAVIVVGVPLATPDLETRQLIDYYDFKFGKGWDYGYIYPAMTKALQAAGRCVRTMEDRGVVAFLDKRFTWPNYLKCIPPEWRPIITKLPAEKVRRFFSTK